MLWFTKSRRAQSVDDYETWVGGGVTPTLNDFDRGDVRATVLIFYGNRVDDIRMQGSVINTLQARMGTGGNNMPMIATSKVRRLTPTESERLQGFPDGWTEMVSDSSRYKQMGNAITVPVARYVFDLVLDRLSDV